MPAIVSNEAAPLLVITLHVDTQPLDTARLKLFKSDTIVDRSMTIGDFVEADFDGYGVWAGAVWGTPWKDIAERWHLSSQRKQWTSTDPVTTPNTIYGYYLTNEDEDMVFLAERFASPIGVSTGGTAVFAQVDLIVVQ